MADKNLSNETFELSARSSELFKVQAGTLTAAGVSASTLPRSVLENVQFIGQFNPTKIPPVRVTKVVVLSQEPGPDMFLPAGTPVNLVMAIKEDLPVVSFDNIETVVTTKYPLVGSLLEDLGKANDAVAGPAKKVLDEKSEVKYSELQPQDAKAVNDFIKNRFNVNADVAADKDKAASIYENLRFLSSF